MKKFLFLFSTVFVLASHFYPLMSASVSVSTYDQLIHAIREVRSQSQARIEQAVDQEKVREAWETGKLIDEHVLQHKERADYGKQVVIRLAKDLGTSETELKYALQFARTYPIRRPADELSWSHYQSLMALNDPEERKEVAEKARKEHWNRDQTREEVRKRKAAKGEREAKPEVALIPLKLGKPGTYNIVKATAGPDAGKLVIDLGFSNYYKTSKDLRFKEGDLLETVPAIPGAASSPTDKIKSTKRKSEDLFTYSASVFDILDGDTIKAVIDLGFGVRSVQTLRFRGLDAPEIISREGKEAKAFLEKELKKGPALIKTLKSDKYDRYLADVFVNGEYINQKLVEQGFAVVMED